jgi:hypothetical protein
MNSEAIEGKIIAIIVWNTEKEDDVHVYLGKLQNMNEGWRISLDEEQLSRLQPVTDDLKEILLNADYAFSMSMENLPETDDNTDYEKTGMNWDN